MNISAKVQEFTMEDAQAALEGKKLVSISGD